ncbi:PQQ-binding-like beta-propeller repeat protein [Mucilaginibacter calamicampi]|uniref:PQQ-binding-like beta-propeller repeat protein n=1 Tax=Mucilaginibacter calamicampi TaxID=1302352 RepID=A0ABW2YX34_9SPHI
MKARYLNLITYIAISTIIAVTGCKKDNYPPDKTAIVIPESVMLYNTYDNGSGTTINLLNAVTGELVTKYNYPAQLGITWSYPVVGNNLLYAVDNKKISAITLNSGAVMWTVPVDNMLMPVLHDDTFYGANKTTTSSGIYALDATKATTTFLWKYQPVGEPSAISYFNSLVYVLLGPKKVLALDAKTGVIKWEGASTDDYSFDLLRYNIITAGNTLIDAATGNQLSTISPLAIPPTYNAQNTYTNLDFATNDMAFIKTSHYDQSPGLDKYFLSAVNRSTGAEKWRIDYGGGNIGERTSNKVMQIWNNYLLVHHNYYRTASRYGAIYEDGYVLLDLNTGAEKLVLSNGNTKGLTGNNIVAGNTLYIYKRFEKTIYAWFDNSEPANYLFAVDMVTGQVKWDSSKLLPDGRQNLSFCVTSGGKAYSAFVQ